MSTYRRIDPNEISGTDMYRYLTGAVAPRPIALASTVDKAGNVNLSPFSFFNVFGSNPPILVFSPARRGRDHTTKDTLENVLQVAEVTISIVNYEMVQQMSLTSGEYGPEVDEFVKSGLHPVRSEKVAPPRVGESPVSFECVVKEVKPLGDRGGAGNLVICEVVLAFVNPSILSKDQIDPVKLSAVARMGGNWYCHAQGDALFEVPRAMSAAGMGVDQLPLSIRNSKVLTGNHLGLLGAVAGLPDQQEVEAWASAPEVTGILQGNKLDSDTIEEELHRLAAQFLDAGDVISAWKVLLQDCSGT